MVEGILRGTSQKEVRNYERRHALSILVVVETNFAVGYCMEQGRDFKYLIDLTESYPLTISIPEYSLREAKTTVLGKFRDSCEQLSHTRVLLREIGRSEYARNLVDNARTVLSDLVQLLEMKQDSLKQALDLIASRCVVIPHSPIAHVHGLMRHIGSEPPFKESDCEIYECILEFLRNEADNYDHTIVLTFDKEHFDNVDIRDELTDIGVDLVFTMGECIAMTRYALGIT